VFIDVVLVVVLLVAAIAYVRAGSVRLPRVAVVFGTVLATVSFAAPLILNHVFDTDFLHRLHKLLAYVGAFVVFVAWVAVSKYMSRRRSSKIRSGMQSLTSSAD
jgi:hypothetical protein